MAIIVLFDRTEIIINDKEQAAIEQSLKSSKDGFITIRGYTIKKSSITSVKPGGITETDIDNMFDNSHRIEANSRCRGQYSIQKEINDVARGEKNWGKLIQNKKWREATRLKLRETEVKWCDYKANECACEQSFLARHATFDRSGLL